MDFDLEIPKFQEFQIFAGTWLTHIIRPIQSKALKTPRYFLTNSLGKYWRYFVKP